MSTRTRHVAIAALVVTQLALVAPGAITSAAGASTSSPSRTRPHTMTPSYHGPHAAPGTRVNGDDASGMDLNNAWNNYTTGDPNVVIAYVEGGINWHLGDAGSLANSVYVNWHELPVPCTASVPGQMAGATMVVSGQTVPCALTYSAIISDYDVNGATQQGVDVVNASDWKNDPRVTDANKNGVIDPEDLIAAFSNNVNHDGSPYANDISGWDFYDNQNDPATADTAYGHANAMMGVLHHQCPGCTILPIRAGDEALDTTDRLAQAWLFAADEGARIIVSVTADLGYSSFMAQTVAYLHSKGIMIFESSNDFDSTDHQGGMFWPWVVPGNGVVATANGQQWTRSDLTSWGTHAMFSVPTGGGSTSESTPTTGGVFGLLLSYGDLAYSKGILSHPLDGPEALQVMRETANAIQDPTLPWPGSPGEWNLQYGYGVPDVFHAMEQVQNQNIPPAPYITSPAWYIPVDPTTTSSVPVTGTIETQDGAAFTWSLQYALGPQPTTWMTIGTGSATGTYTGTLGSLDLGSIPSSFWSAPYALSATKSLEKTEQYTVSFRVVVTDTNGKVGEDRRAIAVFHDPTAQAGFPKKVNASGESQPALVDLTGTGVLDIVFADADGYVHALDPRSGSELPGFPVHTNPLQVINSHPGVTPGFEPVLSCVAVGDLTGTGNLDIVTTSMNGHVYVFDNHGNLLPGWPQYLNTNVPTPPIPRVPAPYTRIPVAGALANPVLEHMTGGQSLQIVQAGADGYIHVFNADGTPVPGWPVKVALPSGFALAPGHFLINDQKLDTPPVIADLERPGVHDVVIRSQYTEITGGGITISPLGIVFAYRPDGTHVPGWPAALNGTAEYYGSAQEAVTEGTDTPVAGRISGGPTDQVVVNPVWTPPILVNGNGTTASLYNPPNSQDVPFTSTAALGMFGGVFTLAQSEVSFVSLAGALLNPNAGTGIANTEAAFPAGGGGQQFTSGFPGASQGLDFLGGPIFADVTGNGQASIIEGGDSSTLTAYQPGGAEPPGFPKFTSGWIVAAPASGDLYSNGSTELVSTTREGYLFVWDTPGSSAADNQWWRWRHDEWNTGNAGTDSRPPGVARNISWIPGSTSLSFTAPGDDWYTGTVTHYEISYAPSGDVVQVGASGPAGTTQAISVPPGTTGVTIQAVDHVGNLGAKAGVGAAPPAPPAVGYYVAGASGAVFGFGAGNPAPVPVSIGVIAGPPTVAVAADAGTSGLWTVTSTAAVSAIGNVKFTPPSGPLPAIDAPIAAIASTADGGGYWLADVNGGVYAFGDAAFYGSATGLPTSSTVVAMAATPDGRGYWLTSIDGSVYAFGDAAFYGSLNGSTLASYIEGISPTPDGGGYWLVGADGGVFAFGDAVFYGSPARDGGIPDNASAVVATPDGLGYWVFTTNGGVYCYGDAPFYGSAVGLGQEIIGAAP